MSNYVKATNFTAKDSLPTGNSGKIIRGTEIDTELTAVASAVSSKADINSPTFTGTPAAPTATSVTNTTQVATTAFVQAVVTGLSLDTMSTQAADDVAITGGSITGITDLAVADGGTGRSTLTDKAVLIGAGTGGITSVSPGTSGNVLKSDGTNWTSAAITTVSGLGLNGETWHDVTGSRAFGTTYTNSYSYPIMVSASSAASSNSYLSITVAGTEIYRNAAQWNGAGAYGGGAIIVPPGATYSITAASSLLFWRELY